MSQYNFHTRDHHLKLPGWLICFFLDNHLHRLQSRYPMRSMHSRNSQLGKVKIVSLGIHLSILMPLNITWAVITIARLCFSIISCTISAIIQSRLCDCPVSFLSATTTGYRAGFPCTPCTPGTIYCEYRQFFNVKKTPMLCVTYQGSHYYCRIVYLYHFLHSRYHYS